MKPRLLDLFCGAGGATRGYQEAGFYVVGVDHKPQPRYCGDEFFQDDALAFMDWFCWDEPSSGRDCCTGHHKYDAIHASPPCQAYSVLRRANPGAEYPDLIAPTRELLEATGLPWVIENVPGSPTRHLTVLCGSMFGLGSGERQLRRHRNFEANFPILSPPCAHRGEAIGVYGNVRSTREQGRYTFGTRAAKDPTARRGGYQGTKAEKAEAMGIDWMMTAELNQAIPPAYTRHIGEYLVRHLRLRAGAAA